MAPVPTASIGNARHSPEEVEEGAQEGKQSNDLDPVL